MELFMYIVLACVAREAYGKGITHRDTSTVPAPTYSVSGQTNLKQRSDATGDPYNTGGKVPSVGPIYAGGVRPDPPYPGQLAPGECVCVPLNQCHEDGFIGDDGTGIIMPRVICADDEVCCKDPGRKPVTPYIPKCGISNENGIRPRILQTNGTGESEFGEWPWQAAVLNTSSAGSAVFECGATLIGERYLLTAAHCVENFQGAKTRRLQVRLGEWDRLNTGEFLASVDYEVSNIIIHPQYKSGSLWNDIAILFTVEPIKYQPHISPICLPTSGEAFEGHTCFVTGWGKNTRKGRYSDILKEVKVPVIDNYTCQEQLRRTRLGQRYDLHDGFLCAGAREGEDSCTGDGGGPLACYRDDGRYIQAGIVSWGIECGMPNVPGVYIKITRYLDWISASTQLPIKHFHPK